MRGEGLDELAGWAEAQLPELIDEVCAAVRERIDLYRGDDVVPAADLYRSVDLNLRFMLGALVGQQLAPDQLDAPRETGRTRAHQGAPLPEVLRVYRIGYAMLWDLLVARARRDDRAGTLDALLDAASRLWELTDEHALALTEAYRAATAELLVAQQRRRSALVEALLTGQPVPNGPWEAGKLLGLAPDANLAVVVAETRTLAEESLVGVERSLAELGIVSAWQLTPAVQAGIASLREDQHDALLRVLRELASARTGVSPLFQRLADAPRALHFARVALAGLPPGKAGVRVFSSSPLAALVASDPEEGRRLAEDVLGGLLDLPADDRDGLLDTLHAVFDNGGSTASAARALHCHPNTVRYRLRRIHELTGRPLSDPRSLAELVTASYALRSGLRTPQDVGSATRFEEESG
ncbi:helix-turn-helix domain-containing protein [Saccharopolyspora sp. NPDC002686]|uniref:PucR family transcriptional regulator n=1 Tax=Saccharopolyspora sp. NPDC002686 TaxID=3154541 RepID=UPI003328990D